MTILSNTLADRELNTSHNTRWPSPNHNFVPEYQQSGVPHAEKKVIGVGTTVEFTFTHLTRWISISSAAACYINFNDDLNSFNDAKSFYIPANTTTRFELKCKKINIKGVDTQAVYVLAGLTGIPSQNFPDQTSANGFFV